MKKMLFTALVAACAMTACGTKTTETAAAEEVVRCRGLIALLIWGQSVAAADLGTWVVAAYKTECTEE